MSDKYLVIMRGLVRERGHWGPYLEALQQYLPEYKIIAPNIPGTGDLYQEDSCTSIPKTIKSVRAQVKKIIPKDAKIDLCAVSLGGMVATAWLQSHPEDFNKAILVNTSYRGLTPFYKRMQLPAFFTLAGTSLSSSLRKKEESIYSVVSNSKPDNNLISTWVALAQRHPVSTKNAIRQLWAAACYKPDLETKPRAPILLLAGAKDRLCSIDNSYAIAKLWDLPLEVHPTAGHEIHHDETEWTFNHIKNWLYQ